MASLNLFVAENRRRGYTFNRSAEVRIPSAL
jgi:hypothetical protein